MTTRFQASIAPLLVAAALFAVAATCDEAHAATPSYVQGRAAEIGSGSQNNLAFSTNNTAGNLIVVYALWDNTSAVALTDTRGNTYASAAPATAASVRTASATLTARRMARRKEATTHGLLVVDKPAGVTSHDVVGMLRRAATTNAEVRAARLAPSR